LCILGTGTKCENTRDKIEKKTLSHEIEPVKTLLAKVFYRIIDLVRKYKNIVFYSTLPRRECLFQSSHLVPVPNMQKNEEKNKTTSGRFIRGLKHGILR
jgi:hypothetical protein